MTKLSKLPPRGLVDIEVFTPNDYVLTIRRSDGKELSIYLTKNELTNLVEYMQELLKIITENQSMGGD